MSLNVEDLSDGQLRTKLLEYGYPVGPVTQTTRKILIKKLSNLMQSKGGGSRHSMVARYSSDDTDDDSSAASKKKKKNTVSTRRQTLANPMPPPQTIPAVSVSTPVPKSPSKKRMSTRNMSMNEVESIDHSPRSLRNRSSPKLDRTFNKNKDTKVNDVLETGSDSDSVEEIIPKSLPATRFSVGVARSSSKEQTLPSTNYSQSTKTLDKSWSLSRDSDEPVLSKQKEQDESNNRFRVNLPKPNKILETSKKDSVLKETKKDDVLSAYETPFLSEFTRKLSVQASVNSPLNKTPLRGSKFRSSMLNSTPEVKESDSNGYYNSPIRPNFTSQNMTYVTSSLDKTREANKAFKNSNSPREENKNSQNLISMVLLAVVTMFFGILAFVYLGLEGKADTFPALPVDSDIPICSPTMPHQNQPGSNCVPEDSIKEISFLMKKLHPVLVKKRISSECDGNNEKPYLTTNQIVKMFAISKSPDERTKVKEHLNSVHLLIFKNPSWGMILVEDSDESQSLEILDTMDKVFLARLQDKVGIAVSEVDLPLGCHMKKKILSIASSVLIVAFGCLLIIGGQKVFYMYLRHRKNSEKEVFHLVSEIINMLEQHHQNFATSSPGGTQESYLAINHIRDNLIPPRDRKKLSALWDKAVKFLDENESRIRREVQLVSGEEFQVWRWLPCNANSPPSPTPNAAKMSKVWQGSAFETMEGSVNSPASSPTPCLKIRHMFDPEIESEEDGEDWETKIKDAILEKCGETVNILHIKVDRGSREGCVYLKCNSQEDAGKAYKALHGCWFDGHLVTVKYLRLERYHERFPESIQFKTPLKPSNNQRLSMQVNFWTNSSDAN